MRKRSASTVPGAKRTVADEGGGDGAGEGAAVIRGEVAATAPPANVSISDADEAARPQREQNCAPVASVAPQ